MEIQDNQVITGCIIGSLIICLIFYRYLLNRTIQIENFNNHTIEY
jgi:hypothetical protein